MVITKTPFRMSFFGGGTDIEQYFKEYGGSVISTTIDKYCHVTVRHLPPFFDYNTEIVYSKIERVRELDRIEHPLVRNALDMLDIKDVRISYEADLPARSGLGTSSSFAIGLLNAFYCFKGIYVDKKKLAQDAIYLERTKCQESGGWQDQVAASFGGFNKISFDKDGFYVKPIIMSQEKKKNLEESLIMIFTGFTRLSSEIQRTNNIFEDVGRLNELKTLVNEAERTLTDSNVSLDDFGHLLDYTWQIKKQTGKGAVSSDSLDYIYNRGLENGALGGKLLGAGGGGFMVFYVRPEEKTSFLKGMSDYLHIPFSFENEGTTVMYYNAEEYE